MLVIISGNSLNSKAFMPFGLLLLALHLNASLCKAQCFPHADPDHLTLSYNFSQAVDKNPAVMHVRVTIQGEPLNSVEFVLPQTSGPHSRSPWNNLVALSKMTRIDNGVALNQQKITFPPGQALELSYDLQKDWDGPLIGSTQFNPLVYATYFEFFGANALAHPKLEPDSIVTVNFDWSEVPLSWTLATSFGAGLTQTARCQSFTGIWDRVDNAVFAGGDFRLQSFAVGRRQVMLAIRGEWSFTDVEAAEQLKKPLEIVRRFWNDDDFPYFLITLAPFDEGGSTDGTAYTNAFWYFMGKKGKLTKPRVRIDLVHEAFHAWNTKRMGVLREDQGLSDWFHEGITDYYASILAYKAGLISPQEYADYVNQSLREYMASKSPYTRGIVIGLWLDSSIRTTSKGKHSLDDVMYQMVSDADQTFSEGRVLDTLDRFLSVSDRARLREAIANGGTLPLAGTMPAPCIQITMDELPVFDMGLDLTKTISTKTITSVVVEGPAYKAGLRNGQKIVSAEVIDHRTDKAQTFVVLDGEGQKTLTYYAINGKFVHVPQLHTVRDLCSNE